jgi:hypothetical protein
VPPLHIGEILVIDANAGATTVATFTATLSWPTATDVTYTVFTGSGGSAKAADGDFREVLATAQTIPAGQTSKTFNVDVLGDAMVEGHEIFALIPTNAVGAVVNASHDRGLATIQNDDGPLLSIGDVTVTEGNAGTTKSATFTVSLSQAAPTAVTYNIFTAADTGANAATATTDYLGNSLSDTIPAGQLSKTFSVTINGDATLEPPETFLVKIGAPIGASLIDGVGVGTITNDDAGPMLSVADVGLGEGNSGTRTLPFTVQLSQAANATVTCTATTSDGSATAGSDYVALSTTVTLTAGQTSKTVSVTLTPDLGLEPSETFSLDLNCTALANAIVLDGHAVGTILNDDTTPSLTIANASVDEPDAGGSVNAYFLVSLSAVTGEPVTFNARSADGTATGADADFVALAPTVYTIPAGSSSMYISVPVNGDAAIEANETFQALLTGAVNATIADGAGTATIFNNDGPTLSIADVTITELDSGSREATFTVTLSQAASTPVTFNIATTNGTAYAGSDYAALSITGQAIPAGMLSRSFAVAITGDTVGELEETFTVDVSSVAGASVRDGQAIGRILASDTPTLVFQNHYVREYDFNTSLYTSVNLSRAVTYDVSLFVETVEGTIHPATEGSEFQVVHQWVTIPAGQTQANIQLIIIGDNSGEVNKYGYPEEQFTLTVTQASPGVTLGGYGSITIQDDDCQLCN